MKALVVICLLAFAVVGCDSEKGAGKPASSAATAASGADKKLSASKIKVPAQYRETAQKEITGDNVDEKVDALENEILADAKKK
jgi:hypothetical protein